MAMLKEHSYIKAKSISAPDAEILEEIMHIKKAFKDIELIKAGKLKTRPVEDLLNEI